MYREIKTGLWISLALISHAWGAEPVACLIEPQRTVKLASPVPGVLDSVMVDRGDHVTKGALVARLESGVEAADVASAELHAGDDATVRQKQVRAEFLESKRARLEQLRATSQYVSTTALEEASSDARVAQAEVAAAVTAQKLARIDLEHARAKLAQREIRSPIDGVVTERTLNPGEYAYDQAAVLTVAQLDPLNVEAFLPVALYGAIKPGSQAEVRPETPVDGVFLATVAVVDKVIDSRSGTFGVRLNLANPGSVLPGGIRCHVALLSE